MEQGRFPEAREKYNKAYLLDPTNRDAIKGLDRLRDDAIMDYNRALWAKETDPDAALKLLDGVKNRLSPTDKYFRLADEQIREIKVKLMK